MALRVALLRGINVGRAKRISMEALRALVEGAGFTDVRSVLASGNLVFEAGRVGAATAAHRLEAALTEHAGFSARVTGLDARDFLAAVGRSPFGPDADPSRVLIGFPRTAAARDALGDLAREHGGSADEVLVGPQELHVHCPRGVLESARVQAVDRALGEDVTFRNLRTARRVAALLEG